MTVNGRAANRPLSALACAVAVAGLSSLAPESASADVIGSGAIFTSRPCTAAADEICVVRNVPRTFTEFYGGYGGGLDTGLVTITPGETAQARVSFGENYLPTIGVASTAGDGTRTGANASAFRSFTYTGEDAIDLAIRGELHYVTSGDAVEGDGFGEGALNAVLGLYSLDSFLALSGFGPGSTADEVISSPAVFPLCGELGDAATGATSLGTTGDNRTSVSLTTNCAGGRLTLHTGDSFVVVATLQALSNRGGFIDAFHTFSVDLDPENTYLAGTEIRVEEATLRSSFIAAAAVPEPSSWALMIGGFGLAGGALRSRRRAAAQGGC